MVAARVQPPASPLKRAEYELNETRRLAMASPKGRKWCRMNDYDLRVRVEIDGFNVRYSLFDGAYGVARDVFVTHSYTEARNALVSAMEASYVQF